MENLKKSFLVRGNNIVGFSDKKNFSTAPLGTVLSFAGQARPNGYLLCDGASYKVTDYPDLYAVISNTYGGDSTNFNVPNLVDASQSPAPTMIYIIKAFHTNEGVDSDAGSGEENKIDSISVNGSPVSIDENKNVDITVPDAYDDTALVQRVSNIESDYATKDEIPTVPSKVSELTNDSNYQTAEQVNSIVTTEIAKVVADAPEDFDTLKEMSDWIAGHEDDASAMNSAISDNKTAITALQTSKADKSEIPTTVAELTDSTDYAKKTNIPTTLPANGGNADTVNNHTVKSDVPENAVFTDTVYDDTEIKENIDELNSNFKNLIKSKTFTNVTVSAGYINGYEVSLSEVPKIILFIDSDGGVTDVHINSNKVMFRIKGYANTFYTGTLSKIIVYYTV